MESSVSHHQQTGCLLVRTTNHQLIDVSPRTVLQATLVFVLPFLLAIDRMLIITGGFCVFNFAMVFICSWLYLQGGKNIKATLSPKARKERKMIAKRESEASGGNNA